MGLEYKCEGNTRPFYLRTVFEDIFQNTEKITDLFNLIQNY